MLEYHGSRDTIDETKMATCLTKIEYTALNMNDEGDKKLALLFFQNKKACAIMVIRQESNLALAMINKTKTNEQPHGVTQKTTKTIKQKSKPNDMSAEIKKEAEIYKVQF